eukprot:scaffold120696_cov17-Tisochrysis_lutea.AAC.1
MPPTPHPAGWPGALDAAFLCGGHTLILRGCHALALSGCHPQGLTCPLPSAGAERALLAPTLPL